MEFENTAQDARTDYLRFGLPEIVRMKYSNSDKMLIQYTPPSISITDEEISKLTNGILLYGNFNTIHSDIVITFNISINMFKFIDWSIRCRDTRREF